MRSCCSAAATRPFPPQLMGAASADVPAIMLTGGPSRAGRLPRPRARRGHRPLALRRRAARRSDERARSSTSSRRRRRRRYGHCNEMGTASTMASLVEALGMSLPGHGVDPRRRRRALRAPPRRRAPRGRARARGRCGPSQILTAEAFDNAITLLMAIGGGTNAVIHLLALAGRVGVPLTLDRFDELSRRRRVLANLRPSGEHLVEDLHRAGGVPARPARARAAAPRRCADGHRQHARERLRRRPRTTIRDVIATLATPLADERRHRRRSAAASPRTAR